MRVISYGENYKPQTIVCLSCKSELEYDFKDIRSSSRFVADKANSTRKEMMGIYVSCPVCGRSNPLSEKEYVYKEEKINTPKRWFGRNKER